MAVGAIHTEHFITVVLNNIPERNTYIEVRVLKKSSSGTLYLYMYMTTCTHLRTDNLFQHFKEKQKGYLLFCLFKL